MKIRVNGREQEFKAPLTVKGLLDSLGLDCSEVAVELNRKILQKEIFESTRLAHGDVIEIVRFVGGG